MLHRESSYSICPLIDSGAHPSCSCIVDFFFFRLCFRLVHNLKSKIEIFFFSRFAGFEWPRLHVSNMQSDVKMLKCRRNQMWTKPYSIIIRMQWKKSRLFASLGAKKKHSVPQSNEKYARIHCLWGHALPCKCTVISQIFVSLKMHLSSFRGEFVCVNGWLLECPTTVTVTTNENSEKWLTIILSVFFFGDALILATKKAY